MEDMQIGNKTGSLDDLQSASEQRWTGIHPLTQSASMQEFPSLFFKPQDAAARTVELAGQSIRQQIESEVALLHSDIEGKNRVIGDLRQKHDELKTGYGGLQLNYDTLQSGYNDLLLKFKQQKEEKEEAENNYNEAFDALENAAAEVDSLTQQVVYKDKQIGDLENKNKENQKELNIKQEEINKLNEEVQKSRKGSNSVKILGLKLKIANKCQEIEKFKNSKKEEIEKLESEIGELNKKIQKSIKQSNSEDVQKPKDQIASKRQEIEKEIENFKNSKQKEIAELESKIQKLKEKQKLRREKSKKLKNLKSNYETLKAKHEQTEALLKTSKEEKEELSAQLREANRENEYLSQQLTATKQQLADAKRQLKQTEADLQQTKNQLQQLYSKFNNIETKDKREAIAYLKGLSKLIQSGQFPEDKVNVGSTSGLWDGKLSSIADIQSKIDALERESELEFAKEQGTSYYVNQIVNEMMQAGGSNFDANATIARINLLTKACHEIDAHFPIGKAVVRAAAESRISDDPTYQTVRQNFGLNEAQNMGLSVLQSQAIGDLCRKANTCFAGEVLDFDSAGKLFDVINNDIPAEISQHFKTKICEKWGRQIIDYLKNGQDEKATKLFNNICAVKDVGPEYFVNLEADDIEKQIKDLREKYANVRGYENFFDDLDEAVKNMRNFRFDAKDEIISCDEMREALFNSFDSVLQILAKEAHRAGESSLLRDITNSFDLFVKKSESFLEKLPFQYFAHDRDMCQKSFDFASKILPNVHKFRIDNGNENFVDKNENSIPFSTVLPSHLQMFKHLQGVIGYYTDQVTDKLGKEGYKDLFHRLLASSYKMKESYPSAVAGLMRLSEIYKHHYTNDTPPVDILSQVDDNDKSDKLKKAYLLAELKGISFDPQNREDVEEYNRIIDIANETEAERKEIFEEIYANAKRPLPKENDIEYFLKNDLSENGAFFLDALKKSVKKSNIRRNARLRQAFGNGEKFENACKMCDIYSSGRDLDELHKLHSELSLEDIADFVSQKYYPFRPTRDVFKDLEQLGLSPKSIQSIKGGQSPSERASQKAEEWKSQFAQMRASEDYQNASNIREAVNVTNASFWSQVGDSLIDIGRKFCGELRNAEASEKDVNSIRDYFYTLIRECEANGGGIGIIPQTPPF